jgi:hypothetical protein
MMAYREIIKQFMMEQEEVPDDFLMISYPFHHARVDLAWKICILLPDQEIITLISHKAR